MAVTLVFSEDLTLLPTSPSAPARIAPVSVIRAGEWFLHSGIQEPAGGVARYHYISERRNARISTEITGYAVSALLEVHERTGDERFLEAATRAGDLLVRAWDPAAEAMPFEWAADGVLPEHHSYFFDNGIIIRGLIRLWRATSNQTYLDTAVKCAESMSADFVNKDDIHPILVLPEKTPLARDGRWSRTSQCYQLKSALGWLNLYEITGNKLFEADFTTALERSLQIHASFFDGVANRHSIMDRLHSYSYFLEALLSCTERPGVVEALAEGIERVSGYLRDIRDEFERSDVNAQLLRVRLWAHAAGVVELNVAEATEEATRIAEYQMTSHERRLDGGFNFGRRGGEKTDFANPVSASFCLQALALWDDYQRGQLSADWHKLI